MAARRTTYISLVLLVVLVGAQASAQSLTDRKYSFTAGSFFETSSTTLRVDGQEAGSRIDFEEQLGIDESDALSRFSFDWQFMPKHSLQFGYYGLKRSASTQIQEEIEFDGDVYPIDALVEAEVKFSFYEASYTYWAYQRPKSAFGITGGIVSVSISAALSAESQGGGTAEISGKASTDLPVPLIGASYRHMFGDHVVLTADATFLPSITYDNYNGSAKNISAGLEYEFLDHYGIGATYNVFGIDFEAEGDKAIGSLEYDIDGPQAYFKFFW